MNSTRARLLFGSTGSSTHPWIIRVTTGSSSGHSATTTRWMSLSSLRSPRFPVAGWRVRPIGVLLMEDEGASDEKLLAVPQGDPRFAEVYDLKDLPHHWLSEVENFFATYKVLEGKESSTGEWKGAKEACLAVARRWCEEDPDGPRKQSTGPRSRSRRNSRRLEAKH
jgi:Inorganic pyrophosphatase